LIETNFAKEEKEYRSVYPPIKFPFPGDPEEKEKFLESMREMKLDLDYKPGTRAEDRDKTVIEASALRREVTEMLIHKGILDSRDASSRPPSSELNAMLSGKRLGE